MSHVARAVEHRGAFPSSSFSVHVECLALHHGIRHCSRTFEKCENRCYLDKSRQSTVVSLRVDDAWPRCGPLAVIQ